LFDQYLRSIKIPEFQYSANNGTISYRWRNVVPGFNLPVKVKIDGNEVWLTPTEEWQTMQSPATEITVDKNFYVTTKKQD
ncbi:MAG TPA: M1 family peptidase, partial [Flavihumibacter sp.]|nr:M1 family peptidase [Flavihumibacter sp.]